MTVQVVFSLACIIGGAWGFVRAVEDISASLGLNGTLLALVIAPIATELPEKLNSVLWVRRGKDTLAMGNITGAMVFQSAIPTSIGLVFAAALLDRRGRRGRVHVGASSPSPRRPRSSCRWSGGSG